MQTTGTSLVQVPHHLAHTIQTPCMVLAEYQPVAICTRNNRK
jgi:hypothetical protein